MGSQDGPTAKPVPDGLALAVHSSAFHKGGVSTILVSFWGRLGSFAGEIKPENTNPVDQAIITN